MCRKAVANGITTIVATPHRGHPAGNTTGSVVLSIVGERMQVERIMKGVRKAGKDPKDFDVCGCAWFSISEDGKGTETDTLKDVLAYFGPYMDEETLATVGLSRATFAETQRHVDAGDYAAARAAVTPEMMQLAIVGSPKDAIEKIEMLAEAGVTQISIGGPLGPDPAAAIRLIGEKVIPHFR